MNFGGMFLSGSVKQQEAVVEENTNAKVNEPDVLDVLRKAKELITVLEEKAKRGEEFPVFVDIFSVVKFEDVSHLDIPIGDAVEDPTEEVLTTTMYYGRPKDWETKDTLDFCVNVAKRFPEQIVKAVIIEYQDVIVDFLRNFGLAKLFETAARKEGES